MVTVLLYLNIKKTNTKFSRLSLSWADRTIRKTNREKTCTERLSSVKKSNEFRK